MLICQKYFSSDRFLYKKVEKIEQMASKGRLEKPAPEQNAEAKKNIAAAFKKIDSARTHAEEIQVTKTQAKLLYQRGTELIARKKYQDALLLFEESEGMAYANNFPPENGIYYWRAFISMNTDMDEKKIVPNLSRFLFEQEHERDPAYANLVFYAFKYLKYSPHRKPDDAYHAEIKMRGDLERAGIFNQPLLASVSSNLIPAVLRLRQAGVALSGIIEKLNFTLRDLTPEQMDQYITAIVNLKNNGVDLSEDFFANFSFELAQNSSYSAALVKLQKAGISAGNSIGAFSLLKAQDTKYVGTLIMLHESGVYIDDDFVERLTIELSKNQKYLDVLIRLAKAGVQILDWLSEEKAFDEKYLAIVSKLSGDNELQYESWLRKMTIADSRDQAFIEGLAELLKNGINMNYIALEGLDREKIKSKPFRDALIAIEKSGTPVSSGIIDSLSIEKAKNPQYMRNYIPFIKQASYIFGLDELTLEKGASPIYVDRLLAVLHAAPEGMRRFEVLDNLKIEYVSDEAFIQKLIEYKGDFARAKRKYIADFFHIGEETSATWFDWSSDTFANVLHARDTEGVSETARTILNEAINEKALSVVQNMNRLHEFHDSERLKSIEKLSIRDLYQITVYGQEEVFTSTFLLIFGRMIQAMKRGGIDAADVIAQADPKKEKYRTFFKLCSRYGKLDEFLDTIRDQKKKNALLREFIEGLRDVPEPFEEAVAITETFISVSQAKQETTITMEAALKDAYEKTSDPRLKKLYGVISSAYAGQALTQEPFFAAMQSSYPIDVGRKLESKELVNSKNEIIERHFFYDDSDGRSSFDHFLATYKKDTAWNVIDNPSYIVLKRVDAHTGITNYIYANKPEYEDSENIKKELEAHDLSTIIIVHRGHSYHAWRTISRIPLTARIVFLGSCGGFVNAQRVLERVPKASLIGTKAVGTMAVNDVLLKLMSEKITEGKGISWPDFWTYAKKKITDGRFDDYIAPHHNIAVQILRTVGRE